MGKKEAGHSGHHSLKRYILTKVPVFKKENTIKEVLAVLEKKSPVYECMDYIYVNDSQKKLIGVVSVKDLFNDAKSTSLERIMKTKLATVSPQTEIEKAAHLALTHNLKAMPVVESGKLVGVVSSRKIMSIVNRALKADILHFAGIHHSHLDFENSMEIPLIQAMKHRLLWLLTGLAGAMLIAAYIGFFEKTLGKYLILAAFVPAIVYASGALGVQMQTVLVRDLAILGRGLNFRKYLRKQMTIAFLNAVIIGAIMYLAIRFFWGQQIIALVIAIAAFISLIVTSFSALIITLLIKRFRFDPALGSGPIATMISDMTSVVVYFVVSFLLLP